jgi:hypothetical protein
MLVAALLLLGCAGCGGAAAGGQASSNSPSTSPSPTSTPTSSPRPSATPSPSASPTGPVGPTKPTPPQPTNDRAGRIAFARYVVHAFEYGFGTNDPSPIMSVALRTGKLHCASCDAWARYLRKQDRKGLTRRPSTLPVTKATDLGQVQPGLDAVNLQVRRPRLADVDRAGRPHRVQKAIPDYLYEIGMSWQDGRWQMTGWLEKDRA